MIKFATLVVLPIVNILLALYWLHQINDFHVEKEALKADSKILWEYHKACEAELGRLQHAQGQSQGN